MTYEELVSSMEDAAELKNREILERAKREAADIRKEAEEKATANKERHLQNSQRSVEVKRNRLTYLTHEEVKAHISLVKKDLYDKAFLAAGEELSNIRESDHYSVFFKRMLYEAIPQVGTEQIVLHIDRRDLDLCKSMLEKCNIQAIITPDLVTSGGLTVSSDNGTIIAHNTIEYRLERAKEALNLEIYAELSGG